MSLGMTPGPSFLYKEVTVNWQDLGKKDPRAPKRPRGWRKARARRRQHVRDLNREMLHGEPSDRGGLL